MFAFKLPIYINGLIPSSRDMRPNGKGGGSNVKLIIEKSGKPKIIRRGKANSLGEFKSHISSTYVFGNIRIIYTHPFYKDEYFDMKIDDYGVVYTAKIFLDYDSWNDCPSEDKEWVTQEEYVNASENRDNVVRQFRYDNKIFKLIFFALFIMLPIIPSTFFPYPAGILVSILIAAFMLYLGKYRIGLKRLF